MYVTYESAAYLFSYGGIVLDIIIGPLLLFRKTFIIGFLLSAIFHSLNKMLFNIGIFPYVMMGTTVLFIPYDWISRFYCFIFRKKYVSNSGASLKTVKPKKLTVKQVIILTVVIIFLIWWVLFPLRSFLYPGDVAWNEEGHSV